MAQGAGLKVQGKSLHPICFQNGAPGCLWV